MGHSEDDETLPAGNNAARSGRHVEVPPSVRALSDADEGTRDPTWTQEAPLSAPPSSALRRAGDYRLSALIGAGGFGVVYRGEHIERRTPAAVKILHSELASDPEMLVRFAREIEAIQRLRHPNVVEVFDSGWLPDGRPYFAMELLDGISLQELLRSRGRISPEETLGILRPLCSALEAAHARAVVHRDLKPSNVFLCALGTAMRVVLLDFGIAKLLDATGPALTSSRVVIGTLSCIAPEQLTSNAVDPRTDVYALGALLYTMVTGSPPFGSVSAPVVRQLLIEGRIPRPSARARVGLALEEVIVRAMSQAKEARHTSVTELLADVRRAVERDGAGGAPEESPTTREAVGVYVEALADPDALGEGDEHLLIDFESIVPSACAFLVEAGLTLAVDAGTSALFVTPSAPPSNQGQGEEVSRSAALAAALSFFARIEARAGRDERVRIHVSLHQDELVADTAGKPDRGALLDLAVWVPAKPEPGVFASARVLSEIEIDGEEITSPGVGLLRIVDAASTLRRTIPP